MKKVKDMTWEELAEERGYYNKLMDDKKFYDAWISWNVERPSGSIELRKLNEIDDEIRSNLERMKEVEEEMRRRV